MANSKFTVSGLMGAKETPLSAFVDEIIQLWTSMWIADAEHDNAIAENVQGLQRRCLELVRRIALELQPLQGEEPLQAPEVHKARPKKLAAAAAPMEADVQVEIGNGR
jgi:hypothetical protein